MHSATAKFNRFSQGLMSASRATLTDTGIAGIFFGVAADLAFCLLVPGQGTTN